ncbi:hypothetical protein HN451_04385 [archaeon]|nr:hypothetical protein [archaeon]
MKFTPLESNNPLGYVYKTEKKEKKIKKKPVIKIFRHIQFDKIAPTKIDKKKEKLEVSKSTLQEHCPKL